jgi:hypothetical protein
MSSLMCLRHPKIDAQSNPELTCKTCCTIFVNAIRMRRPDTEDQVTKYQNAQKKLVNSLQTKLD